MPIRLPEVLNDRVRLQPGFATLAAFSGGEIIIRVLSTDGNAQVQVSDTGIGIPAADLSRVFERFYRADKSRSRDSGGAGLGLSIAKWIAEAHQGAIEARSEQDRGSTFVITLPGATAIL